MCVNFYECITNNDTSRDTGRRWSRNDPNVFLFYYQASFDSIWIYISSGWLNFRLAYEIHI